MCGIFGVISEPGRFSRDAVERAVATLAHRGPDDSGAEVQHVGSHEIWLGHTRLSIVDLSHAGHQPMSAADATIVFNGEIYNHRDLRRRMDGHIFASSTDTEVLLRGLADEGPEFLRELNGMFAFGLLEPSKRRLILGRDRVGKKPLYVYETDRILAFASELKAFRALGLELTIDEDAFAYFRWMGYFPARMTAYRECRKLEAGSWATVDLAADRLRTKSTAFWDPLAGYANPFTGSYDDALDQLGELVDDATRIRLDADVPVGAFLSGGIDSSLVVASVCAVHQGGITAYTVGTDDQAYDESAVARDTARRLGIDIEVLQITNADFERQIALITHHYDEPLADSSQIPTLAVSEQARKHVKVVLTGDGGDELFLGYPWFGYPEKLVRWRRLIAPFPPFRRPTAAAMETAVGRRLLGAAVSAMGLNTDNLEIKQLILGELLRSKRVEQLYDPFKAMWQKGHLDERDRAVLGTSCLVDLAQQWYPQYGWDGLADRTLPERLAAVDMVTFMRDDVLVKVDRATMAYSLEARSPLLDHRIVHFASSLPAPFKFGGGEFKKILRDAVRRRIGGDLASLGKKGFGVGMPPNLPQAPTPAAAWSKFVEREWRREHDHTLR